QRLGQDLDRDGPLSVGIACPIDVTGHARPDQTFDFEAAKPETRVKQHAHTEHNDSLETDEQPGFCTGGLFGSGLLPVIANGYASLHAPRRRRGRSRYRSDWIEDGSSNQAREHL